MRPMALICVAATAVLTLSASCHAQSPSDFYRGKTVEIYIGTSVGGGYDAYARMLARHLGKFLPGNPTVVAKNMEGGGGMRLANFLYNAAAKDGLIVGTFNRGTGFDPLFGNRSAQFEATRFNWLGSTNNEVSVCVAWHTAGIKKIEELYGKELTVGGTGASADTDQFPRVTNGVLGTKFKVITGYPGGNDIGLAMERGEVMGRCGWSYSSVKTTHPDWLRDKKVNLLVQLALNKHPELPDVPLIVDLAKNDEQKQILKIIFARQVMGRPFLAPPNVPQDRVAALRKAFMDTMNDKDFIAEAEKAQLEITPVSGDELQKLVQDLYATPPQIAQKAGELLK
jgi:tripartite-type tricarboxylate transporter receptor subunit TctC